MARTKQFDEDEALDRALELFWRDGFRAASLSRLLEAMGIGKGSFYATFESKEQVFRRALDRYVSERFAAFEAIAAERGPRAALEEQFALIVAECQGKNRDRGCLVLNTALELAPEDEGIAKVIRSSLRRHEAMMADLIEAGRRQGDVRGEGTPGELARALMGQIIAMRAYARSGMPRAAIESFHRTALGLLV